MGFYAGDNPTSAQVRFEYLVVKAPKARTDKQALLDTLGEARWELVQVEKDLFYLKREKSPLS